MDYDKELESVHLGKQAVTENGRNIAAGKFRGYHIDYGQLKGFVRDHPLFQKAMECSSGLSLIAPAKLMNIFLLMKYGMRSFFTGKECVVEFGSYRGGSALFMACIAKDLYPGMKVYALDTFTGMPDADAVLDSHVKNDFSDSNYELLLEKISDYKLDNLVPAQGMFEDTWPELSSKIPPILLSHIDCDLYSSVSYATNASLPKMAIGGYIVYDDPLVASCLGAFQAVEETLFSKGLHAEQVAPHLVFRYPPLENYHKPNC